MAIVSMCIFGSNSIPLHYYDHLVLYPYVYYDNDLHSNIAYVTSAEGSERLII